MHFIKAQGNWIVKISLSSFSYNWDNVIHVIKKINSIINDKESKCDLYTMDYISSIILVQLSNIVVVYSFKIQIQGIDHQEAQVHWVFQMSSSIFPYNWDNVIHVIKKINYIINLK